MLFFKNSLQAYIIEYLLPLWNNSYKMNSPEKVWWWKCVQCRPERFHRLVHGLDGGKDLVKVRTWVQPEMTSHSSSLWVKLLDDKNLPFWCWERFRVGTKWCHTLPPFEWQSELSDNLREGVTKNSGLTKLNFFLLFGTILASGSVDRCDTQEHRFPV